MISTLDWATLKPILAVVFGAVGTSLLLPQSRGERPRLAYLAGAILAGLGVVLLASCYRVVPEPFINRAFFYAFAIGAVGGGILMITSTNPVYSALWFASVVLATCGLFLLAGAQFLAAGTIIVYAGAIIVTFLFVIMLAQAGGQAAYDRAARSPGSASMVGFLMLWSVLYALITVRDPDRGLANGAGPTDFDRRVVSLSDQLNRFRGLNNAAEGVLRRAAPATTRLAVEGESDFHRPIAIRVADAGRPAPAGPNDAKSRVAGRGPTQAPGATDDASASAPPRPPGPVHVAGLGATLYSDHLIVVEVAGAILFVALVGTAAIATPKPPIRPVPARFEAN